MSDKTIAAGLTDAQRAFEEAQARVRRLEQELSDAKAARREAKGATAKRASQPRACACGCGGQTSGGTFLPGHDAKLKSRLLALIDEGGPEGEAAREELRKYPRLATHDWPSRLGRKARERQEKADRKDRDARERAERDARDAAEKQASEEMRRRSREEQVAAAKKEEERKRAALVAAKAGGTVTVPSK